MDAPRYRIGNDLSVFWAIHNRDNSPFDMEGMDVRLFVTNERGRKEVDVVLATLPDGTINNVIRWDFKGEDQRVLGLHTLTVEISESATHREIIRDYCQAFELVGRSESETEEGDANISIGGDLILSSKLDIYRFEATNVDLAGIKESIHDLNETIEDINKEALEIKVTINGIQSEVNDIGTELTTKASVETVVEIGEQITEVQTNVAEQTIRVDGLEAEIETKASTESVTQIGNDLTLVNETVAEQKIRTDNIEASIENLVTKETFNTATGEIEQEFTSVKQTTDSIETTIQTQSGEIASIKQSVNGLSVDIGKVEADLDSLRNQLDGVTESFFFDYTPTNNNEPAATWIAEGKEAEHKGDTFTNTALEGEGAGKSWRWLQGTDGSWGWHPIADTDAQKALALAAQAQAAADGKVTIFYTQPSNYKEGDIWFVHNDSYSPYLKGEMLSAVSAGTTFSLSDWESKTRYSKAVSDLEETMNTTFKDGVLDEAERETILKSLNSLQSEKSAIDAEYNVIVVNADLTDTQLKSEFKSAKSAYDNAYTALYNKVNQIASAKEENLEALFGEYSTLAESYANALASYTSCRERVNEALMGRLNPASVYLENITKDNVLTPVEKEQLFEIYRGIAKEYNATRGNAYNYKIWKYASDGIAEMQGNNGGNGRYETYTAYKQAYNSIVSVFTSGVWGFGKMDETTTLPSGYTIPDLQSAFDTYYEAYGELTEIFSAITASIEEAQKNAEKTLNELTGILTPEQMSTQIGKGVVLSTIIATRDEDGDITAGMNASSVHSDPVHGRVVIAGGVKNKSDWTKATGILYEDGHMVVNSGEFGENVKIGNAMFRAVLEGDFDVFSYPENGALVPLFQVNKDSDGKIVSVSTPYDFIVNKNLIVRGDTSSGGSGSGETVIGTTSIVVDGVSYPSKDGVIDLSKAFEGLQVEIDLSNYATKGYVTTAISNLNIDQYATDDELSQVSGRVTALESDFDTLSSDVGNISNTVKGHTSSIGSNATAIGVLQGYFTDGVAKNATADASGNVITSYYTPISTHNAFKESTNAALASKADKATTLAGYGIGDAYTKTEVDSKVTTINNSITSLDTKYTPVKTWYDALGSLIVKDGNNVRIKTNLIVEGDTASGGTGGGAAIGVTGILVDGKQYTDNDSDGYIDLSEAFAGLSPTITSTMITEALGYVPVNSASLGNLASKDSLVASDIPDLSGKYLPLTGGTLTGGLTISGSLIVSSAAGPTVTNELYPTADNTYNLGISSRRWSNVRTVLINGGTPIHSGNVGSQSVNYATSAGNANALGGIGSSGYVRTSNQNVDNFLDYATSARFQTSWIDGQGDFCSIVMPTWASNKTNDYYLSELRFVARQPPKFRYSHNGVVETDWKTIAFTDSNVASAQALKHSNGTVGATVDAYGGICLSTRGIWSADGTLCLFDYNAGNLNVGYSMRNSYITSIHGNTIKFIVGDATKMFINSSGNVTIGNGDLAETNAKLYVDGVVKVYEATSRRLYTRIDSSSIQVGRVSSFTSGYRAGISYGVNELAEGYIAGLYGTTNVQYFFYGGNESNAPLFIRNGHVLIGTKNDAGSTLYVYGDGRFERGLASGGPLTVGGTITANAGATITGDVRINGNLVVTGDTASGGTAESTNVVGPVNIIVTEIFDYGSTQGLSQSVMDSYGLTMEVINNMLSGLYTKVVDVSGTYNDVWSYGCYETSSYINVFFSQGDGFDIHNGISMRYNKSTALWDVIIGEI